VGSTSPIFATKTREEFTGEGARRKETKGSGKIELGADGGRERKKFDAAGGGKRDLLDQCEDSQKGEVNTPTEREKDEGYFVPKKKKRKKRNRASAGKKKPMIPTGDNPIRGKKKKKKREPRGEG